MYNTDAAFVLYSLKKNRKISGQTIHAYVHLQIFVIQKNNANHKFKTIRYKYRTSYHDTRNRIPLRLKFLHDIKEIIIDLRLIAKL